MGCTSYWMFDNRHICMGKTNIYTSDIYMTAGLRHRSSRPSPPAYPVQGVGAGARPSWTAFKLPVSLTCMSLDCNVTVMRNCYLFYCFYFYVTRVCVCVCERVKVACKPHNTWRSQLFNSLACFLRDALLAYQWEIFSSSRLHVSAVPHVCEMPNGGDT